MANKIYRAIETTLLFADTAQTEDAALTLSALAAGAARISLRYDFSVSGSEELEWRATFQMGTAGVVGESIDIYISTSDGTNPDGEEGAIDAALGSTDSLKNMQFVGSVIIDTTSIDTDITASGRFTLSAQYASVVVHNNTADALKTDTGVHGVKITRVPAEIQ